MQPIDKLPAELTKKALETMKAIAVEDRPRERLLRSGAAALSDAELLAVLLRTGRRGRSAVAMARDLLEEHGGLSGLLNVGPRSLRQPGLAAAKAATLLAAVEVGRRLARAQVDRRRLLDQPNIVAEYLALRYCAPDQEVMGALFLDVRHRLIGESDTFRGTLRRAVVEPRVILKGALMASASGLILFHTHPSGDPSPSAEDLEFTRRMARAGEVLGIALVDHMILGGNGRWVSLQRRGAW